MTISINWVILTSPITCYLDSFLTSGSLAHWDSGTVPKCINNLTALTEEESPKQKITTWYFRSFIKGGTVTMNTSYDASAFFMWKGREFEYSSILGLVKSIDLSSNELVGAIPEEITSLVGLLGLTCQETT